jgi:hypothetical protein
MKQMPTSKSADISESKLGTKSGIDKWAGVRHNEMHRFVAQIILMGITFNTHPCRGNVLVLI